MKNTELAKLITDTLIERNSKGVPGTMGMPLFLGGDMCDPRPEGIEAVVLEVLEAQWPEERALELLERCRTALDDWINTYASDMCSDERVAEAVKRIGDNGGTLAYIAEIQQDVREYLKRHQPQKNGVTE